VQVGSPFLEKLLIEACLELLDRGLLLGLQDLGAAGLTSSSVEAAHRAGSGIEIDVAAVSPSEGGMTPLEVMLSESQERMLAVVAPERAGDVRQVLDRWGLRSDVIGHVIDQPVVRILEDGRPCGEVPVAALTEAAPSYDWPFAPATLAASEPLPRDPLELLAHPNIASKRWVFRQYDQTVQAATAATDEADAALVLLPGGKRAIALCTDGNARSDDPYLAGALAVAEAARNVSCTGARPIALTNCLNFGSPERPEGAWQLREAIRGLSDAARALDIPVISGNVSLYNETPSGPIRPTPVVGMLGLLDDVARKCTIAFKQEGDTVMLIGPLSGPLDLEMEARVHAAVRALIARGVLSSAHDCSDGGLFVALAECCLHGNIGATIDADLDWFEESPSRVVVSASQVDDLSAIDVPVTVLGAVGGDSLCLLDRVLSLSGMRDAWENGLEGHIDPNSKFQIPNSSPGSL
jgi:phosphoribosylformylglycinamidine synthase II